MEQENNLTGIRLRTCRLEARESMEEVGRLVGVNKSTVMHWERGDTGKINLPTVHALAQHFRVNEQWLLGYSDDRTAPLSVATNSVPVPVMGSVRGGCGGIVMEEISGYEPVDAARLRGDEEYFWLRVSGDSMAPVINDSDLVLVRRQESVDSGRYAVVMVNGEEGLVKRVVYSDTWIELQSENPYYPPRRFEGERAACVTVVGLVIESKRKFC